MVFVLASLGLVAGVLTTLAGQGGGLVLLVACSAVLGPHTALAITSPALLLGNAHRALLYRRFLDRSIAAPVIASAMPAALAGGLAAERTPAPLLHALMLLLTAVALARAFGWVRLAVPRWGLFVAGAVVGAMTGATGGAGVMFAPILLATGLSGAAYVATLSTIAFATHTARVAAYGATGLLSTDLLGATAVLTVAIFAGNFVGERLRARIPARACAWLEYGSLVIAVALSVSGVVMHAPADRAAVGVASRTG